MKTFAVSVALGAFLAASAGAQIQGAYLDYYIVKVKPEKIADFEAIAKKIVDANRKNGGDTWLAFDTMYGDNDTVAFVSTRKDLGAIDTANEAFRKALKSAYGDGVEVMMHEFEACTLNSRGEIRKRRPDLSVHAPTNDEDYAKLVGEARYLSTTILNVKPGHASDVEQVLGMIKAAAEKNASLGTVLISQAIAGDAAGTYYVSRLGPSIGAVELPPLKDFLSAEEYGKYAKVAAESMTGGETMIAKVRPELSNPPAPVVEVSRDFWTPQPSQGTAARAKKKSTP